MSEITVGLVRGLKIGDCTEGRRLVSGSVGPNGVESWAKPALMATDVWMHRRKGELCKTTLYLFRFRFPEPSPACSSANSSSTTRSRIKEAIRAPRFFACCQPL